MPLVPGRPPTCCCGTSPLNYLDIASREQIEEVVLAHTPTLVFVEHDQWVRRAGGDSAAGTAQ